MTASSTYSHTNAHAYEQVMGRWSRRLAEPFLDFSGWREGEHTLDAGCGPGNLSFALAARTKTATIEGVDFVSSYIDDARERNRDPRIAFRVGDICALPFDDASFDRVLSLLVLHFVPKATEAIAELRRVARPGATVAAAVWDTRGGYIANRIFFDAAAMVDDEGARRRAKYYTRPMTRPGELAAAWQAAGFGEIREAMLPIRMEFSSFDDYWTPLVGQDGSGADYVATLDAQKRDRLQSIIRASYLDGEPDGPRSYAAIAWAVAGVAPG